MKTESSKNSLIDMSRPEEIRLMVKTFGFLLLPFKMLSTVDWVKQDKVASLFIEIPRWLQRDCILSATASEIKIIIHLDKLNDILLKQF